MGTQTLGMDRNTKHLLFFLTRKRAITVSHKTVKEQTDCPYTSYKEYGNSQLNPNHGVTEYMLSPWLDYRTDDARFSQLIDREENDQHTENKHAHINHTLQRNHLTQHETRHLFLWHNVIQYRYGYFRQAKRKEQSDRHCPKDFGKQKAEHPFPIGSQTLTDTQFTLTIVKHLNDELQEIDEA